MNSTSTALTHPSAPRPPATGGAPPREPEPNPLKMMHSLLRGRYALAVTLAVALGTAGALAGYLAMPLEYESRAQLRFAPVLPRVLYEVEDNSMMPMFEAFIQTQASVMQSRRVVDLAMQSRTWREAGGAYSLQATADFGKALKVNHLGRGQLVEVVVTDRNPQLAQAAVKSIVDAYLSIYGETDLRTETQRLQLLEERHKALTGQIEAIRTQILQIANEFGSDSLEGMYTFKLQELQKLESQLKAATLALLYAEPAATDKVDGGPAVAEAPAEVTEEQVALVDAYMRRLVEERNRARVEVEIRGVQVGPQHRSYLSATERLRQLDAAIERHMESFAGAELAGAAAGGTALLPGSAVDVRSLKAKVQQLQTAHEQAKAESLDMGRKHLQIQKLRADMDDLKARLDETNARIEQLNVESAVGGRISLVSEAEVPLEPANARRRMQITVLGGLGGLGLGLGMVMLLGLLSPRIRDCVDAGVSRLPVLGVVPRLPEGTADPASAAVAAHCVHQLRVMVQMQMQQNAARVFSVTSADSGTGKTSITLSLGFSLAASGVRTLVVDGDPIGAGLTRRSQAIVRRRIGQILLQEGRIDKERLDHGLLLARESGMLLGSALVELGYVEQNEIDRCLTRQKEMRLGMADVVRGERLDCCVTQIGVPNLYVLPAGRSAPGHTLALSPVSFDRAMQEMRSSYDVVLIDTGPVPGCTDASIMAAGADRVIMVTSRGESSWQVRHALQHLEAVRASVMGLVFNRARNWDLTRSGQFSSAVSNSGIYSDGVEPLSADRLSEFARFGPVPQAVVVQISQGDEGPAVVAAES